MLLLLSADLLQSPSRACSVIAKLWIFWFNQYLLIHLQATEESLVWKESQGSSPLHLKENNHEQIGCSIYIMIYDLMNFIDSVNVCHWTIKWWEVAWHHFWRPSNDTVQDAKNNSYDECLCILYYGYIMFTELQTIYLLLKICPKINCLKEIYKILIGCVSDVRDVTVNYSVYLMLHLIANTLFT